MLHDDVIFRLRVALFAHAERVGVSQACRDFGIHRSTYYRWRPRVKQWGVDALRPRERRLPQMPNHVPPWVEERVVAFALGFPGFGPRRIAAELRRERWQGIVISANGVWRILKRHGISTRLKRLSLIEQPSLPHRSLWSAPKDISRPRSPATWSSSTVSTSGD